MLAGLDPLGGGSSILLGGLRAATGIVRSPRQVLGRDVSAVAGSHW
jgi:hypothetical protein